MTEQDSNSRQSIHRAQWAMGLVGVAALALSACGTPTLAAPAPAPTPAGPSQAELDALAKNARCAELSRQVEAMLATGPSLNVAWNQKLRNLREQYEEECKR